KLKRRKRQNDRTNLTSQSTGAANVQYLDTRKVSPTLDVPQPDNGWFPSSSTPEIFQTDKNHASVNSRKILESVRSRCRSETTPIPSIYDEEITKLRDAPWDAQTLETAQKLPTFESKRSSLYRTRHKLYPGIPNTRPRIQLEGNFAKPQVENHLYKLKMVTSTSNSYLQLQKIYNCALQTLYTVMELSTQHHQCLTAFSPFMHKNMKYPYPICHLY
ncbi:Hypothetical predicted protein, partial [Mytilus galloprovincialis]